MKKGSWISLVVLSIALVSFTSCLTSKRLDKFVAAQYNNELPKPDKKKKANIDVSPASPSDNSVISTTVHTTDKFLPLIVYWHYKHRQTCLLNTAISVSTFSNAVNSTSAKGLIQKLNGQKLELTVEQARQLFRLLQTNI